MKRKGISLIELMVVIIVLGILATLALPNIKNIAGDARNAAAQTDVATVQTAVDMYVLEDATATLPTVDVNSDGNPDQPGANEYAQIDFNLLVPTYLREVPESADTNFADGRDTNKYFYVVDEHGKVYIATEVTDADSNGIYESIVEPTF